MIRRFPDLNTESSSSHDSKSEIKYIDPKTIHGELYEEAWDKIPDAENIKTELGWNPTWATDDIIKDVIRHYE